MKFIKCPECNDLIALRPWKKTCRCGKVSGVFKKDNRTAVVSKDAIVLGVDNNDFFQIPEESPYLKRKEATYGSY